MSVKLGLIIIDTHSSQSIAIGDYSSYPTGFNIVSPTVEISADGFSPVTLPFVAKGVNIYNSTSFNITCTGETPSNIPDGIYTIKYTINPALTHFVTKTIMRTSLIQEKFDSAFLKLDLTQCDMAIKEDQKQKLDTIYYYIQESIAAANQCANSLSVKLYNKADKLLNQFINQ